MLIHMTIGVQSISARMSGTGYGGPIRPVILSQQQYRDAGLTVDSGHGSHYRNPTYETGA